MVNSHDMADVGTCQTIQLLHLFGGIIVVIAHEVSPAQFFKMLLGIIGTSVFSLGRYLMAVSVCPECRLAHTESILHVISCYPLGDAVDVNGSTKELINMPFAVIVLASDTAHRYLVALGGCKQYFCIPLLGTNVLPQNSHFLVGLILFDIAMFYILGVFHRWSKLK